MWMNEYEIEDAYMRYRDDPDLPNLATATTVLSNLAAWTNRNSDGWPYWRKPAKAAAKLMSLLQQIDRFDPQDISEIHLKQACVPIKSFLTREAVPHSEVFPASTQPRLRA